MYTVLLRLNGPLQSWGSESYYDNRDTDYFPTKSGVLGMVAAAMGLERGALLTELTSVKFGIRVDNQGEYLNDFQITDMGKKLNKNLSNRRYLSDATFLVGLSTEDEKLAVKIKEAILHPLYIMYLGRRSCPPTQPVFLKTVESELYDALYDEDWLFPEWRRNEIFKSKDRIYLRIVVESNEGHLKKDVPVDFNSQHRQYEYRYIKEMQGKMIYKPKDDNLTNNLTEHDPMKELE